MGVSAKHPWLETWMVESMIDKLGGPEGVRNFLGIAPPDPLAGNLSCVYSEEGGVITIDLPPTSGMTGQDWIKQVEKKGNRMGDDGKKMLLSPDFVPTTGLVYRIKVLKNAVFPPQSLGVKDATDTVYLEARNRQLYLPHAEVGLMIREYLTGGEIEKLGLKGIVVMHKAIINRVFKVTDGRWLLGVEALPEFGWSPRYGFAFLEKQAQVPQ